LRGSALTAWLAASPDAPKPSSGELRDFLRRRLPDPMIPEVFIWLETLPLTPNGKLDRRALPDPLQEETRPVEFEAPDTPVEEGVAAIWCEILSLDRVGRHDNFFELGGHSLLAVRVTAALREKYGVEVPLPVLFEKPTVAEQAQAVADLGLAQVDAEELEQLLASLE
jgi:acyl carrier protein